MAVKSKAKSKSKAREKAKSPAGEKRKSAIQAKSKTSARKGDTKKKKDKAVEKIRVVNKISPPRASKSDERKGSKTLRMIPQYNYMKAPGTEHDFHVGDKVEVFCDHEEEDDRVRGWIAGIVVQVDNKMVAVQFRSNVFLTDGWMVPDRILWYPLTSEHIRGVGNKKSTKKEKEIPDY